MAEFPVKTADYLGIDRDDDNFESQQKDGSTGHGLVDPGMVDSTGANIIRTVPAMLRWLVP